MQPTVSVCMITYNHAHFIAQALDSVLMQQTDFPYEIVVGDDHSTDGTTQIVLDYRKRYPDKIRALQAVENLGKYTGNGRLNFFRTLQACRGKYVALLDGDDYWTDPAKLQKQVELMELQPDVAYCGHRAKVMSDTDQTLLYIYPNGPQPPVYTLADVVRWNWMNTCTLMFRGQIARNLPEWMLWPALGDWPLQMHAATQGKVAFLDAIMGCYRVHPGGYWSGVQTIPEMNHFLELYETIKPHIPVACWRAVGRRRVTECHIIRAVAREAAGDLDGARKEAWDAIRIDPGILVARPFWTVGSLFKIHRMKTALKTARLIRRVAHRFGPG